MPKSTVPGCLHWMLNYILWKGHSTQMKSLKEFSFSEAYFQAEVEKNLI